MRLVGPSTPWVRHCRRGLCSYSCYNGVWHGRHATDTNKAKQLLPSRAFGTVHITV